MSSEFAVTTNVTSSANGNVDPTSSSVASAMSDLQASATAESLKWSLDSIDDTEMVYASNITVPVRIKGKSPRKAWLAKHKFDGVDFSLPTPDSIDQDSGFLHRSLRGDSRRLGLTDWSVCSASSQCNNGCCSEKYSAGVLKCTPLTAGYRSDICVGGAPPSGLLGDWAQCSSSSQCGNGCCSGTYSAGVLKCTPLTGGYRSDICVGGGPARPTPPPAPFRGEPHPGPQRITTWACYNPNRQRYVSSVQIWWGHTAGDGSWACNNWRGGACKNRCSAVEVTKSHWNCYRHNDLKFMGQVIIEWGHGIENGVSTCNNLFDGCGKDPGGCLVTGAAHWNDDPNTWGCDAYKVADGCSGPGTNDEKAALGFACNQHDYCYYGPIKNDYWDTYRHCSNLFYNEVLTRHWGLLDTKRWTGQAWKDFMFMDSVAKGGAVLGPGFGDSFQNQQLKSDWECYLGKSKPQGYKLAPCQGGGGCAAGTSCFNCCDGDSGSQCNKPWWE